MRIIALCKKHFETITAASAGIIFTAIGGTSIGSAIDAPSRHEASIKLGLSVAAVGILAFLFAMWSFGNTRREDERRLGAARLDEKRELYTGLMRDERYRHVQRDQRHLAEMLAHFHGDVSWDYMVSGDIYVFIDGDERFLAVVLEIVDGILRVTPDDDFLQGDQLKAWVRMDLPESVLDELVQFSRPLVDADPQPVA